MVALLPEAIRRAIDAFQTALPSTRAFREAQFMLATRIWVSHATTTPSRSFLRCRRGRSTRTVVALARSTFLGNSAGAREALQQLDLLSRTGYVSP